MKDSLSKLNEVIQFYGDTFYVLLKEFCKATPTTNMSITNMSDTNMPNTNMSNTSMALQPEAGSSEATGDVRPRSKSLTEKIRDLGIKPRKKRISTLQHMDIKLENNRSANYRIMKPNLNLNQVIYLQPEISYDENNPEKSFYKISRHNKHIARPHDRATRISDIPVTSYKPIKKIKYRAKRRDSMMSKVKQILSHSKGVKKNPSEESVDTRKEEREVTIKDLPESVLQKIFLNFTPTERNQILNRVCKSWYYMLKDPIFWTEMQFKGEDTREGAIFVLINRYPDMKKLSLISIRYAVPVLQELCRCNNGLTHLKVKNCVVNFLDFSRIIHRVISCCQNLEVLEVKGMPFHSEGFYLDLGRLRNLRSINLSGNKMIRSQDLITLSVNCRSLKEFKLLDIALDSGQGYPLSDEDMTFMFAHMQLKLKTLKLDMQQLRNMTFQAILKCVNLTTLVLKNCLFLSREVFRQLPTLQNLNKLKITRAINVKSEDFQFIFGQPSMKKIEVLDINGCWGVGEGGLRAITQSLSSLKSLSLKSCKTITGRHLMYLYLCPQLTELNVAHTAVEGVHLPSLYQYAKALKILVIDHEMYKQSIVRQLKRFYPLIKIIISYSEFQKEEKPLEEFREI